MAHLRRTLVTGGAGFIGSHLVERLLAEGCHVTVLDDFSAGTPENLTPVMGHPALVVQETDITREAGLRPFLAGVEWVFHLAALADGSASVQRPLAHHRVNVDGTANVVETARLAGAQRFVYAASASCYGVPDEIPTPETAALRPRYPHALTKSLGEQIALHWGEVYGLPVVSLRLVDVFGPRARTSDPYGDVLGMFLAQKLAGQPFTVVGSGTRRRDFIYVSDVVDAFIHAAEADATGAFNVGSGSAHSINEVLRLLGGGDTVQLPGRPGEPPTILVDTKRIARHLRWRARISFQEGIALLLGDATRWREAPLWTAESVTKATQDLLAHLSERLTNGVQSTTNGAPTPQG